MNVSELIIKLKELKEIHGDLTVAVADRFGNNEDTFSNYVGFVEYVHVPLVHERFIRIS